MPSQPPPRPFAPGSRVELTPQGIANLSPFQDPPPALFVDGYAGEFVRIVDANGKWLGNWRTSSLKAWQLRIGG